MMTLCLLGDRELQYPSYRLLLAEMQYLFVATIAPRSVPPAPVFLERHSEDPRKAEDRREAHDFLKGL